jgi:hypothetical protein
MQRFKSVRHSQRPLFKHSRIHNHFQLRRPRLTAINYRAVRAIAFRDLVRHHRNCDPRMNFDQRQASRPAVARNLTTPV